MFGKKHSDSGSRAPVADGNTTQTSGGFAQARVSASPQAPSFPSASVSSSPPIAAQTTLPPAMASIAAKPVEQERLSYIDSKLETPDYRHARRLLLHELVDKIDVAALERLDADMRRRRVREFCDAVLPSIAIPLTQAQLTMLRDQATNELLGFGPLEPLLADAEVADILINTSKQVYVERGGKLFLSDVTFTDEQHLLGTIQRIVSRVGRRVDEANPMVDARMPDGSRFNAIIPPLALDGCLVSIRKFKKSKMPLSKYVDIGSMSQQMADFLAICGNIRLNMIISGGTGSGKTTLLNALSGHIDIGERVITIEDAAELQLHQPHVLRLETRPSSIEGKGEITQRQLVRNALRMRPDRIILGEIRGDEVIDVLTAMNTGHDGSMATIHANTPRDAMARIENLVAMSAVSVSQQSVRYQIASAINIIIQIQRMRDGARRITNIDEIAGTEGGNVLMQPLFSFRGKGLNAEGALVGEYVSHSMRPYITNRAEIYGRDKEMLECFRQSV